jgi:hypothetical protein
MFCPQTVSMKILLARHNSGKWRRHRGRQNQDPSPQLLLSYILALFDARTSAGFCRKEQESRAHLHCPQHSIELFIQAIEVGMLS